jgi:hypothetical protein
VTVSLITAQEAAATNRRVRALKNRSGAIYEYMDAVLRHAAADEMASGVAYPLNALDNHLRELGLGALTWGERMTLIAALRDKGYQVYCCATDTSTIAMVRWDGA